MSSRELYKRFTSLCQKWPRVPSKTGRDYGEFFRKQINEHFPHGELGQVNNPREVEEALNSLERIANNNYFNENQLKRSSASGLESWACGEAVSNEGLRLFQESDEITLIQRLKNSLNIKFVKTGVENPVTPELIDNEKKNVGK